MRDGYSWFRHALASARWVFGPFAVLFLVVAGIGARGTFENVVRHAHWPALIIAVLLWSALHLLSPAFTWVVLRGFGTNVRYVDALAIHVNRLPARYLPGGIWHTVSRVVDLHGKGVSRTQLATMVALENILPVSVALVLGGAFLLAAGQDSRPGAACMMGGVAILACLPALLRHRAVADCRMAGGTYFLAISITAAFWLVAATAFARYWLAFPAQAESGLADIYAAYLLGWASGFIAVFAPQGLGVFESVAGALLRGALPFAGATMLVAGFRVTILAADVIAYALFSAVRFARRKTHVDTISNGRL
ncbi:hypothetical protein [Lysobacter sp. Root494]|jgi:glycosyltransferase 2 family protein|uniref:hypothetical protein n=1 Tax=Lysobacter sp. Root494 TaxID=1736549 RepID=UPI0009E7C1E1|nr:hypothetical protein [Lysobacter sp. Root494]